METDTAIIGYRVSNNTSLTGSLLGLETAIETAARANLSHIFDDPSYTMIEKRSMLTVEMFRQVNGLDLVAVLLRGKYIKLITEENMLADHPDQYTSLEEMAKKQGVASSELSNTRDLVSIIFPYIENVLGIPIINIWYDIGKSNFREITPILKSLITGQMPGRGSTREAVEGVLQNIEDAANFIIENEPDVENPQEEAQQRTINEIIDDAAHLSNAELRRRIRPSGTDPIELRVINHDGHRFIAADLDDDQWLMLQRRMRENIDPQVVDLPSDQQARMIEAARIPEIRRILQLLGDAE